MRDAADLSSAEWPLGGYAPGGYGTKCRACGDQVIGVDKYADRCLACAIKDANAKSKRRTTPPPQDKGSYQPAPEQPTLRDQFAMAILAGDFAAQNEVAGEWLDNSKAEDINNRAAFIYRFADAMMEARKREPGG